MNLEDFIYETLKGVSVGVARAKMDLGELNAIAPGTLNGERQHTESTIEFDVAVTVAETNSANKEAGVKAGARVKVFSAEASIGGEGLVETSKTSQNSKVSRIAFSVPIILSANTREQTEKNSTENSKTKAILDRLGKDK